MTARKHITRSRRATTGDSAEGLALPDDEAADVTETEARSRSVVRPIRDVPDSLVFRFEVGPAILAQLLEKLDRLKPVPLSSALDAPYPGFYQLFVSGLPKYIGKTARPIGQRLREHSKKLRHRVGIDPSQLECRFAFVEDPSLVDVAEGALIDFFGQRRLAEWNASGFGSKVTGHRRGQQDASEWSLQFPPNLDAVLELEITSPVALSRLLTLLAALAPLTISVPSRHRAKFRAAHSSVIHLNTAPKSFTKWMDIVESNLKHGWRINRQAESWYIEPGT